MKIKINIGKSEFNDAYYPYIGCKSRYLVMFGGAGSGKSVFAAQRLLLKLLGDERRNLLVVRAVGNSNRDSTFALFRQTIQRWGLSDYFKLNMTDMRVTCLFNSNSAVFKGLDDSEKLKSITFARGQLTDIWIEEASEISEKDFNQLDLRLRGKGCDKQITVTFNPVDVKHWLKRRFFDSGSKNVTTLRTTYKDNRFLEPEYAALLESYKHTDEYYYRVYCLGQWGVFGQSVFGSDRISRRLAQLTPPECVGLFSYDENPSGLEAAAFEECEDGYIRIYARPEKNKQYVIGADTAGEGSDSFCAQVIDSATGEQAACMRCRLDEDIFAKQLYCLGEYYNGALIAVETNFSTFPVRELERLGCKNQYVRVSEDDFTHKPTASYGFRTTAVTRPVIIANLISVFREKPELFNDETTLHEMLTFVRNSKGRAEAMQGAHDDTVMAAAIAYHVRPQALCMAADISSPPDGWEEDMVEDFASADDDSRRKMLKLWGKHDENE